jgi:hypothetical protein
MDRIESKLAGLPPRGYKRLEERCPPPVDCSASAPVVQPPADESNVAEFVVTSVPYAYLNARGVQEVASCLKGEAVLRYGGINDIHVDNNHVIVFDDGSWRLVTWASSWQALHKIIVQTWGCLAHVTRGCSVQSISLKMKKPIVLPEASKDRQALLFPAGDYSQRTDYAREAFLFTHTLAHGTPPYTVFINGSSTQQASFMADPQFGFDLQSAAQHAKNLHDFYVYIADRCKDAVAALEERKLKAV